MLKRRTSRRMLDTNDDCLSISPVNKKLNFEVEDAEEDSHELRELQQFDLELSVHDLSLELQMNADKFSPMRTRSGVVYQSCLKRRKLHIRKKANIRSRTHSGQSGTGSMADCSGNDSDGAETEQAEADDRLSSPPPLSYMKNPASRFPFLPSRPASQDPPSSPISSYLRPADLQTWSQHRNHLLSSPLQSPSPPSHTMKAMRLTSGLTSPPALHCPASPQSTPRALPLKSRLLFTADGEPRRSSYPGVAAHRRNLMECDSTCSTEKAKLANVNPFTPTALLLASKKREKRQRSSMDTSYSPRAEKSLQHTLEAFSEPEDDEDDEAGRFSPLPNKRVRVSDINITRYQEEFLELAEIATGSFGMVKQARHRLDGIVYAIKISKTKIRVNSHDEKMAMNEVFAHAALMKHKHVVRYFNSWVEKGQVFIQNEYCEGGSLQKLIEDRRHSRQKFQESELKRILVQVTKGLHYIHSNQLVHLDIKPGNILISVEHTPTPSPHRIVELSDSGAASGDLSPRLPKVELCGSTESSPGDGDKVCYKIGDLGHVCQQEGGDLSPEEGDCRYMAPEFLQMEVDKSQLTKADIFSLGMTIYEAASLRVLPKNSSEGAEGDYGDLKQGRLPYLGDYSEEFNSLLARMVHANPSQRPTANRLLANCELSPGMNKSKWQLQKELNETKEKMMQLEAQLKLANDNSKKDRRKRNLVGRGAAKADSCQL